MSNKPNMNATPDWNDVPEWVESRPVKTSVIKDNLLLILAGAILFFGVAAVLLS